MATRLQRMEAERWQERERLRQRPRQQLLAILRELRPADEVIVFGSLTRPGRFGERSDVDVALASGPHGMDFVTSSVMRMT